MVIRDVKLILLTGSVLVCLASCGYHFAGEGLGPKPGLRCIAIPVFVNKTSEPNAGAIFTDALRQQFMEKGSMRVVPEEDAEAVFKGTITSILIIPVAHNPVSLVENQITVENRLMVAVDIRCEDKRSHRVLWRDPNLRYHKVYQVNNNVQQPDPLLGFENREAALRVLAEEISTRIHDRFLSNF
jgi:outer membrane lipopolysaccharide assembly protein LptE/RlpB